MWWYFIKQQEMKPRHCIYSKVYDGIILSSFQERVVRRFWSWMSSAGNKQGLVTSQKLLDALPSSLKSRQCYRALLLSKPLILPSENNPFYFVVFCVGRCFLACMSECASHACQVPMGSLGTGVIGSCEPLCASWELNLGPLGDPPSLLPQDTILQESW